MVIVPIVRASRIRAQIIKQVQTVHIDYNINEKDTAWLRFQTDNGLQAACTDPINPCSTPFPLNLYISWNCNARLDTHPRSWLAAQIARSLTDRNA
jgi:hypothetical protein